jgi:hypothetical protein
MCLIVLKDFGADKFYRFKNNPQPNYGLLSFIFIGTYVTRKFGHTSTQDPPVSDEDQRGIDLNSPLAIIKWDDPDNIVHGKRSPNLG